jgi:hypothetical protein
MPINIASKGEAIEGRSIRSEIRSLIASPPFPDPKFAFPVRSI